MDFVKFPGRARGRADGWVAAQIRYYMDYAMGHDVFISYEKTDLAIAEAVCRKLEEGGVNAWYAKRNILPGADWPKSILRAIDDCRVIVLVYSEQSKTSDFVLREIDYATDLKKPIIPFCLSPMGKNSSLDFFVSNFHRLDAFPPPLTPHYQKLLKTTQNYISPRSPAASSAKATPPEQGRQTLSLFPGNKNFAAAAGSASRPHLARNAGIAILVIVGLIGSAAAIFQTDNGVPGVVPPQGDQASVEPPSPACSGRIAYSENTGLAGMEDVTGFAEVVCMDSLKFRDKVVKLAGVGPEKNHAVKELSDWLREHGPYVRCQPVFSGSSKYRCYVGTERMDVAKYILANRWASPQD